MQPKIVLNKAGFQFAEIGKGEVVDEHLSPVVFINTDEIARKKHIYISDSLEQHTSGWLVYETDSLEWENDKLFVAAALYKLPFQNHLIGQSLEERIKIVANIPQIEARQILRHHNPEPGLFGYIDDTPFIFLLIALLASILIWAVESSSFLVARFIHPLGQIIIPIIALIGFAFFLSLINVATWQPNSNYALWARNVLVLFGGFLLFQVMLKKITSKLDFLDGELVKFVSLFFGLTGLFLLGNWIGYTIDLNIDCCGAILPKSFKAGSHVVIGLIFAFTLGNLLNNLRKRWLYLRAQAKLLKKSQQANLKSKAELQALQSSINPHFLYNALNSIASLAQQDATKTEQMALALSSFYQYVTNREQEQLSSLTDEIEMLENYLKIEQIRFGDRLTFTFDYSENSLLMKLPRFTLQPLVENAIKYGAQNDRIEVRLEASAENNTLEIRLFDSGKSFDDNLAMGYGLQSVSKKLRLLFPERHNLEFINAPSKQVYLSIDQIA